MAEEYIDKEALMAKIDAWEESARNGTNPNCKNGNEYEAAMDIAIMVEEAPAADVRENVKGRWIPDYDYTEYDFDGITKLREPLKYQDGWQCSLCGGYSPSETHFCPNCGAKMGVAEIVMAISAVFYYSLGKENRCKSCCYSWCANLSEGKEDIWGCQFILIEGHRRGCRPGPKCTEFKPKKKRQFTKSWFLDGRDDKND